MNAPDLYTLAHKPIRLALGEAATGLGSVDAGDPTALDHALGAATAALDVLAGHAEHEDELIAPLLASALPDLGLEIGRQHEALDRSIDAARRQIDGLDRAGAVGDGATLALYRAYQRLVAANLLHLDHEETVVMPALWAAVPASELVDLMAAFRAAHPEAAELFHRWPTALAPAEREAFGITLEHPRRPEVAGLAH